ncbi:hypothetical protein B0H17DRAFT_1212574 [Mycena rosella]|uniref:Uncharacterized protein n=1 Tax=Mycena rosella TaxID=1033263 RepID=A0AAD7CSA7_MYCRO|nr:hypothetical protein B0H17DRAFT_1212574 [Mycena rosella]
MHRFSSTTSLSLPSRAPRPLTDAGPVLPEDAAIPYAAPRHPMPIEHHPPSILSEATSAAASEYNLRAACAVFAPLRSAPIVLAYDSIDAAAPARVHPRPWIHALLAYAAAAILYEHLSTASTHDIHIVAHRFPSHILHPTASPARRAPSTRARSIQDIVDTAPGSGFLCMHACPPTPLSTNTSIVHTTLPSYDPPRPAHDIGHIRQIDRAP